MVAGAEVELSMLFADVRGSSKLARRMSVVDFTNLMSRFYEVSKGVLFQADAIVEKFVGDEVVGLFLPFMTGPNHADVALTAAESSCGPPVTGATRGRGRLWVRRYTPARPSSGSWGRWARATSPPWATR